MKRKRKKQIKLIITLIILLILTFYPSLNQKLEDFVSQDQVAHVDRIIDGDTIESNRTSIRMLGINTPEHGEFLYQEAKDFLQKEIKNKTVTLKFGKDRYDKYDRTLAYIFLNNTNINREMVENGFANYYFPAGRDIYYEDFLNAWKMCIENKVNLCEPSTNVCSQCIDLNSDHSIINSCAFDCNISGWKIKAEGRNNTVFKNKILGSQKEVKFDIPLTKTGDTIFLWDEKGKLVFWERN